MKPRNKLILLLSPIALIGVSAWNSSFLFSSETCARIGTVSLDLTLGIVLAGFLLLFLPHQLAKIVKQKAGRATRFLAICLSVLASSLHFYIFPNWLNFRLGNAILEAHSYAEDFQHVNISLYGNRQFRAGFGWYDETCWQEGNYNWDGNELIFEAEMIATTNSLVGNSYLFEGNRLIPIDSNEKPMPGIQVLEVVKR